MLNLAEKKIENTLKDLSNSLNTTFVGFFFKGYPVKLITDLPEEKIKRVQFFLGRLILKSRSINEIIKDFVEEYLFIEGSEISIYVQFIDDESSIVSIVDGSERFSIVRLEHDIAKKKLEKSMNDIKSFAEKYLENNPDIKEEFAKLEEVLVSEGFVKELISTEKNTGKVQIKEEREEVKEKEKEGSKEDKDNKEIKENKELLKIKEQLKQKRKEKLKSLAGDLENQKEEKIKELKKEENTDKDFQKTSEVKEEDIFDFDEFLPLVMAPKEKREEQKAKETEEKRDEIVDIDEFMSLVDRKGDKEEKKKEDTNITEILPTTPKLSEEEKEKEEKEREEVKEDLIDISSVKGEENKEEIIEINPEDIIFNEKEEEKIEEKGGLKEGQKDKIEPEIIIDEFLEEEIERKREHINPIEEEIEEQKETALEEIKESYKKQEEPIIEVESLENIIDEVDEEIKKEKEKKEHIEEEDFLELKNLIGDINQDEKEKETKVLKPNVEKKADFIDFEHSKEVKKEEKAKSTSDTEEKEESSDIKYLNYLVLDVLLKIFAKEMGPIAKVIFKRKLKELNIKKTKLTNRALKELINTLAEEIPIEYRKKRFLENAKYLL